MYRHFSDEGFLQAPFPCWPFHLRERQTTKANVVCNTKQNGGLAWCAWGFQDAHLLATAEWVKQYVAMHTLGYIWMPFVLSCRSHMCSSHLNTHT